MQKNGLWLVKLKVRLPFSGQRRKKITVMTLSDLIKIKMSGHQLQLTVSKADLVRFVSCMCAIYVYACVPMCCTAAL